MLIDEFLPQHDVSVRYHIDVYAPLSKVYSAARLLDMRSSGVIRSLFLLRGLPRDNLTLEGMLRWGFILLAEQPPQELVFGLIGRFWTPSPQVQRLHADAFVQFDRPGFAKAVGNMAFTAQDDGTVRVTTETRIYCPDGASRRCFRLYWLLIGPFSGIVRKEWLRLIKQKSEAPRHSAKQDSCETAA